MLEEKAAKDYVLKFYGYTYGNTICISVMASMGVVYFLLAWISTVVRSRYL